MPWLMQKCPIGCARLQKRVLVCPEIFSTFHVLQAANQQILPYCCYRAGPAVTTED